MTSRQHTQIIFIEKEDIGEVELDLLFHEHEEDRASFLFRPQKYWICETPPKWDKSKFTPKQNQAIQEAIDQETFTYDEKHHHHMNWRIG